MTDHPKENKMGLPTFSIDPDLVKLWPDTALGLLTFDVVVHHDTAAIRQEFGQRWNGRLTRALADLPLTDMPGIAEARAAFKAFGANPGRVRVSSEALLRRLRQGREPATINSVVDTNNVISVVTGFSLGSYDLDRLDGNVVLRRGQEGESYPGLGKGAVRLCGLPVLCDAAGPFGSPASDSPRACIGDETVRVCSVIYSFSSADSLEKALLLAEDLFCRHARARNLHKHIVR